MNRQKHSEQKVFNYDLSPFMPQNMSRSISFQNDSVETLREKLQIKSEALNLLGKQIEICNKEKSDYKRLIDTLYDKNLSLKKSLYFKENEAIEDDADTYTSSTLPHSHTFNSALCHEQKKSRKETNSKFLAIPLFNKISPNTSATSLFSDTESEDYMKILKDLVKSLQKEKHDLKQKYDECEQQLIDSRSDLKLLREQIVRQRVGSVHEGLTYATPESPCASKPITPILSTADTPQNPRCSLRENLIKEIEQLKEQKIQIESDLKFVQCQKEECEIERDSFKARYNQLNQFLTSSSTHVNQNHPSKSYQDDLGYSNDNEHDFELIDRNKRMLINKTLMGLSIDELISQNKYLNESNRNLKHEIDTLKKLKKSQASKNEISLAQSDCNTVDKNYVEHVVSKANVYLSEKPASQAASQFELVHELKSLTENLSENLNDKLIANVHQRKVNKMLATRIQDLEKELSHYFLNKKQTEMTIHSALAPNQVDTSLNDSIENQLQEPLVPIKNQDGHASQNT